MFSLYWRWLNRAGEVQVQISILENGSWWTWCDSWITGVGIVYVWCLEAFGSKRPRNARVKWKFEVLGQNMQQWWFLMQFWDFGVFRACVCVCYLENSVCIYRQEVLCLITSQNLKIKCCSIFLVFEAKLKHLVPRKSTGLHKVVSTLDMLAFGL